MTRLPLTATVVLIALATVGCGRLAQHPIVLEAVEEIKGNARVADALGGPVAVGTAIRGTANETDGIASLEFDVTGSKGKGVVVVEGKKTRNEWGVTMLELRPAGGEKLSLTSDLETRTGIDTPKFDPNAKPAGAGAAPPPPAEIDIKLPPGPPGQ